MDDCDEYFDRERKMVKRLTEEYRRLHIAMGALHHGLETGEGSRGHEDYEWCEIELEKLYWHLESLGAEWRVDQIQTENETVLATRKK